MKGTPYSTQRSIWVIVKPILLKSIALILLFLCAATTYLFFEYWLPHRTIYDTSFIDLQDDYLLRKKVRNACYKVLSHRIGNYHAVFIIIGDIGNKDSIPYLIRTLKRLHQKPYTERSNNMSSIIRCANCLWQLTGMEFRGDYEAWENWWQETGQHLPFDEEKGQLVLPEKSE